MSAPMHTASSTSRPNTPRHSRGESLLDGIDYRVRLTQQGPRPLSVDGRQLGHGLPARLIALTELSAILMHPSCRPAAQDTVWRLLVANAREHGDAWTVGAVFVALPGLRRRASLLAKLSDGDVEAALVEEFLVALRTIPQLRRAGVLARLLNTAFSRARTTLPKRTPARQPATLAVVPSGGHPDLLLARAVTRQVITAEEAELISATYLAGVSVTEYAQQTSRSRWMLYKLRTDAVDRLVTALQAGQLSDPYAEVINEATGVLAFERVTPSTRQ